MYENARLRGQADQPSERRLRRASLTGKLRDQAFDGGVGVAVDPAQVAQIGGSSAERVVRRG